MPNDHIKPGQQDRGLTEQHRSTAESARNEAEEFRRLAEEAPGSVPLSKTVTW